MKFSQHKKKDLEEKIEHFLKLFIGIFFFITLSFAKIKQKERKTKKQGE